MLIHSMAIYKCFIYYLNLIGPQVNLFDLIEKQQPKYSRYRNGDIKIEVVQYFISLDFEL